MATRRRTAWKPDHSGQYPKQIGWKLSGSGKRVQHKFRLGSHQREAERREARLRNLWDVIERRVSDFQFDGPLWSELTLDWAKQIAGGVYPPRIAIEPGELARDYAHRVLALRHAFTGFPLDPADVSTFEIGLQQIQADPRTNGEFIQTPSREHRLKPKDCPSVVDPADKKASDAPLWLGPNEVVLVREHSTSHSPADQDSGDRLHAALKAYEDYIRVDYARPIDENGTEVSDWGHTQLRQVKTLLAHHDDVALSQLDLKGLDDLFGYWRRRPNKLGSDAPVTRDSAGNLIALLRRFLDWLHRNPDYDWRRPDDYDTLSTKVAKIQADRKGGLQQVDTFSIDELATLMEYGTPLERALLLLALNCGFGAREIATLEWGEVFLRTAHEPALQKLLGCQATDQDSFIKRYRHKSDVYGEWLLFPLTVQAIEWLRQRHADFGPQAKPLVVLNNRGQPYYRRTTSGNFNSQIPARLAANIHRANVDGHDVSRYSFGKLRKTAGNLVRRSADGEVAAVFLTHGQAVRQDDLADVYTNRPFGRLFETLREIQDELAPVFEAAGRDPFSPSAQAYTKKSVRDQIARLHVEGVSVAEIANEAGVSEATVYRHVSRN